jgi:predicted dehydrogenase
MPARPAAGAGGRRRVTVVVNGATGRWARDRHLAAALVPLRARGGIALDDGTAVWPELVLLGRDEQRVRTLARRVGAERWTTRLDDALAGRGCRVYFDAQPAGLRAAALERAIERGHHVLAEKPLAHSLDAAHRLARRAAAAGVTNGAIQSMLHLPGLERLVAVVREGRLGRVLSARVELGYWVFADARGPSQRPSWNYRAETGGGVVFDTFCHWRYVLAALLGRIERVCALVQTQVRERIDEHGRAYDVTAEDSAYALLVAGGRPVQLTASWCTRPRRRELYAIHVDGIDGSAFATASRCRLLAAADTPALAAGGAIDAAEIGWRDAPGATGAAAEEQIWSEFLTCVATGASYRANLLEGARDVQLAELALESAREHRWVELPELPDI